MKETKKRGFFNGLDADNYGGRQRQFKDSISMAGLESISFNFFLLQRQLVESSHK